MTTATTTTLPDLSDEVLAGDVYERVKADFAQFDPEQLIQVNLDVPTAVSTVLGVVPKLKTLRQRIATELPSFDLAAFDKLEDYALAFKFANTSYLMATRPSDDLIGLAEEAAELRETLAADAQALAKRQLLDSAQIAKLKGANGYKNIAEDLEMLSQAIQNAWDKIQGKTAITLADVQRASRMSTRLMRTVGGREEAPTALAAAADQRLRAFTLLIRTYEDARRAVSYLRGREDDADSIAPSLYPGRPRRRSATSEAAPAPSPAPASVRATQAPALSAAATEQAHAAPSSSGVAGSRTTAGDDPILQ